VLVPQQGPGVMVVGQQGAGVEDQARGGGGGFFVLDRQVVDHWTDQVVLFGRHFEAPVVGGEGFGELGKSGAGAVAFGEALGPGGRVEDAGGGVFEEELGDAVEVPRHEGAVRDAAPAQVPEVALEDVPHLVRDGFGVEATGFRVEPDRVHLPPRAVTALGS